MTSRVDSNATIAKYGRRMKPLTKVQRQRITKAHHSLLATRERLGLSKDMLGASPVVGQQ